jgi:HSF-type DNA-binding
MRNPNYHKLWRARFSKGELSREQAESESLLSGTVDKEKLRPELAGQMAKAMSCLRDTHECHETADNFIELEAYVCRNGRHIHPSSLFPAKLHVALQEIEREHCDHIISWASHGRCFMIHKRNEFVQQVLPMYVIEHQ